MKSLVLGLLLSLTALAYGQQATSKKLYGYMNQNRAGASYYVAVNVNYLKTDADYDPLESIIPENWFSAEQLNQIYSCMQNREVYVPVVEQKYVPTQAPTSIPGRMVTVRAPQITKITCEKKPGFIYTWRELVKKSAFR
jgi:hypothetical protein